VTGQKADSRIRKCLTPRAAIEVGGCRGWLLDMLAEVRNPRRFNGTAVRDLATNQMVLAGAEDERSSLI
jgi:hypothetical protein